MTTTPVLTTELIADEHGFADAAQWWDELVGCCERGNPFMTHEWLTAWRASYGKPGDRLAVYVCRTADGRPVGALPLYVEQGRPAVGVRRLGFLGDRRGGSLLPSCMARPDFEDRVLDCLCDRLLGTPSDWDLCDLRRVDAVDPFVRGLHETAAGRGFRVDVDTRVGRHPAVMLPGDWEAFLGTLSHRTRSTVRRARRALEKEGTVAVRTQSGDARLADDLATATSMFEQSMRRKFGRPFVSSERHRAFVATVCGDMARQGDLRLMFLEVSGQPVAFVCLFRYGDTMYAYQTGFDPAWAEHRVGSVAFGYAIEAAIAEGRACFDFGAGAGEHKARWGARDLGDTCTVRVYARSPAGAAAAAYDTTRSNAAGLARAFTPAPVQKHLMLERSWRRLERL